MKESFLIDVLKKGVSPFHCVEAAMQTLEESGFEELEYARPWNLKKGKAYMMNHHGTTLYAFTVGENFRADAMGSVSMGIAGSIVNPDFFQEYLGMRR